MAAFRVCMVFPHMHLQCSLVHAFLATHVTVFLLIVLEPLHPEGHSGLVDLVSPGGHQHRAHEGKVGHLGDEGGVVAVDGGGARADQQVLRQLL